MHELLAKANFDRDVAPLTDEMARRLGLIVHDRTFPKLDATINHTNPIRLRFHCDDWNDQPALIKILKLDGNPWTDKLPGGVFNHNHGGFICMRGSREYHGHPGGHSADSWDNYKNQSGMDLLGILIQLASAWRKAAK